MLIRPEQTSDHAAIRALTTAAFATAPHASGTEAQIIDDLRQAGDLTLSLVADQNGQILGHVAFSPVQIDAAFGWVGLGPVSVAPTHQRQGIGGALIRDGLARLAAMGAAGCVVLGEPDYYRRFGFTTGLLRYAEAPAQYFLHQAFGAQTAAGSVRYAAAFNG